MTDLSLEVRGLRLVGGFDKLPKNVAVAAQRAINYAARRSRTESSRELRQQLNFPARYLVGPEGKIDFRPATASTLEATLSASSRPRSLARFVVAGRDKGRVKVSVKPGNVRGLPGAFILGLGDVSLLAVRSPTRPRAAYRPRAISPGLWSLYGPSVAQALLTAGGRGIWADMESTILTDLETEFLRQMELLDRGL